MTTYTITPAHIGSTATIADARLVAELAEMPDGVESVASEQEATASWPSEDLREAAEAAVRAAIDSVARWPSAGPAVVLSPEDWGYRDAVRALVEEAVLRDPNLNGARIGVELGDFTCVEGLDGADGAALYQSVISVIRESGG